mgnify:CR=1 FL=1
MVFPGDAAPAAESSRTKFSWQTKKASANFSGAKIRGAHFPAGGIFVSVLAGQQPRTPRFPTTSTFLPAPAGQHLPPPFFPYRPTQSLISQLSSSRLGRPTPYISSHYFFNIYKVPSSHQVSLPTILPKSANYHLPQHPPSFHTSSFFYFLYRRHPPGFRLSVPPSHHFPNALHFFRPAAASPTRRPNAKRSFARGCSLQGCRGRGRGARVSSFFFMFLFFLLLSLLSSFSSSFPSPWRRGFAATPSFFFLLFFIFLSFIFVFSFCSYFYFSFCFFLFIFILIFYSCFFFVFSF